MALVESLIMIRYNAITGHCRKRFVSALLVDLEPRWSFSVELDTPRDFQRGSLADV
jgi:hypothetical protein